MLACMQKLGLGACSPMKILCCETASEAIFGPKTPLRIFALVLESWLGNRILIHFISGRMTISVHWQFQAPREPHERATHAHSLASQLVLLCNASRECVATALKLMICSSQVSTALHSGHDSVSVKTLDQVWR